jgi:hypothetical protein
MNAQHHLRIEVDNGHDIVFVCTEVGCGRRVAINRQTHELTTIVQGDFYALHSGGTNGLRVTASIAPDQGSSA